MSNFFYQIVQDAINYDNKEQQAELYDLTLESMKSWCDEQMQSVGVPASFIYYTLEDLFAGDSDFGLKLWQYIQGHCKPDEDDDQSFSERCEFNDPDCVEQGGCMACTEKYGGWGEDEIKKVTAPAAG